MAVDPAKEGRHIPLRIFRQLGSRCRGAADWFLLNGFPALRQRCPVCGVLARAAVMDCDSGCGEKPEGVSEGSQVCTACRADLAQRTGGYCPRCALVFGASTDPATLCLQCRVSPPPWENTYFYGPYEGRLKSLVLRFKFQAQLGLGEVLHVLLHQALACGSAPDHDLVIPVPLHPRRLRHRGFNQSLELARGVSGEDSRKLEPNAVTRVRDTPAQHTLPRAKRLDNLADAFLADPAHVQGRSVLLVDDILTTGATVQAASQALLQAGATRVSLLVLARA